MPIFRSSPMACALSSGVSEEELLRVAAALESRSEHPLAKAVCERAGEERLSVEPAGSFRALPGWGVEGIVDGALAPPKAI